MYLLYWVVKLVRLGRRKKTMVAPIKLTKKGMVEKIAEPDDDGDQKSSRLEISRQVDKSSASLLNIG